MRTLHVPYCYYPDAVGGTEIYVAALAREQRAGGFEPAIAAPAAANGEYIHAGLPVFRFAGSKTLTLSELYGDGDAESARNFAYILDRFQPDALHLHARSPAVSILLARAAKARGVPAIFTYHTPAVTCARGMMLRWGKRLCDGKMRSRICAPCMLHGSGMPLSAAMIVGQLPAAAGRLVRISGLKGRAATALRSHELMKLRVAAVKRMLAEVDHVCAVCNWVREVLITNGVPAGKITLTRQGVPYPITGAPTAPARNSERGPLKLAFLGRVSKAKGIDIALGAISRLPGCDVRLDIFAVTQGEAAVRELDAMKQQYAGDSRIRFLAPLDATEVITALCAYDALIVPSIWMETGPLVVYEAFAAGIPVVGSDFGGIAELVTGGVNGILVEPGSIEAWSSAIARLAAEPELLARLKAAPKPVRTAEDAARDVADVYSKVLRTPAYQAERAFA